MSACDECGGACCRSVSVFVGNTTPDQRRWAELHGIMIRHGSWRFPMRCACLSAEGRCQIYETRPGVCRTFAAGGQMCLEAQKAIKENGDGKA